MEQMNYEVKDGALEASFDKNLDGEKSVKLNINLTEAIQEAFQKGEAVEGTSKVKYSFVGTVLMVSIDSDQDGQDAITLEVNLLEVLQEAGVMK